MLIHSVDLKTLKVSTVPQAQPLYWPALSPDGRYIVATTVDGQELMIFDFASKQWSELARGSIGFTEWSADGKYVYFDTGFGVLIPRSIASASRIINWNVSRT